MKIRHSDAAGLWRRIRFAATLIITVFLIVSIGKGLSRRIRSNRIIKKPQAAAVRQSAPAKPVQAPKAETSVQLPKNTPMKLEIFVKKPVTMKVKVDGALRFGRYLSKGTRETLSAKESINIYVTKAENIELTLNGSALPLAVKGLAKDIEITHKGVRIK